MAMKRYKVRWLRKTTGYLTQVQYTSVNGQSMIRESHHMAWLFGRKVRGGKWRLERRGSINNTASLLLALIMVTLRRFASALFPHSNHSEDCRS
jgi:hypothetical protein